jgi:hypothetical protein
MTRRHCGPRVHALGSRLRRARWLCSSCRRCGGASTQRRAARRSGSGTWGRLGRFGIDRRPVRAGRVGREHALQVLQRRLVVSASPLREQVHGGAVCGREAQHRESEWCAFCAQQDVSGATAPRTDTAGSSSTARPQETAIGGGGVGWRSEATHDEVRPAATRHRQQTARPARSLLPPSPQPAQLRPATGHGGAVAHSRRITPAC